MEIKLSINGEEPKGLNQSQIEEIKKILEENGLIDSGKEHFQMSIDIHYPGLNQSNS